MKCKQSGINEIDLCKFLPRLSSALEREIIVNDSKGVKSVYMNELENIKEKLNL